MWTSQWQFFQTCGFHYRIWVTWVLWWTTVVLPSYHQDFILLIIAPTFILGIYLSPLVELPKFLHFLWPTGGHKTQTSPIKCSFLRVWIFRKLRQRLSKSVIHFFFLKEVPQRNFTNYCYRDQLSFLMSLLCKACSFNLLWNAMNYLKCV